MMMPPFQGKGAGDEFTTMRPAKASEARVVSAREDGLLARVLLVIEIQLLRRPVHRNYNNERYRYVHA